MKKILIILLIILGVTIVALTCGYLYLRFMPDKSIAKQTADFSLSASNLVTEYENNQPASDQKFIDRIILVEGIISEITTDQNNSVVIFLRENNSNTGILCTLAEKNKRTIEHYKPGDKIKIRGICTGMLFDVVLNKCIIDD